MNRHKLILGLLVLWAGCFRDACSFNAGDGCTPGDVGSYGRYRFTGQGTIDDPEAYQLHPTAVGGTQRVTVSKENQNAPTYTGARSTSPGIVQVTGGGSSVTLSGLQPGSATLELVDGKGKRIESIGITAATPKPMLVYSHVSSLPLAALRKQPIALRMRLSGQGTQDLVDENAEIGVTGGAAQRQASWYDWSVAPSLTATTMHVAGKSGTRTSELLTLPVVETIGELRLVGEETLVSGPLPKNKTYETCAYAETDGHELLGIEPTVTTKGSIIVTYAPVDADSCFEFSTVGSGTATITLKVGTKQRDLVLVVGNDDLGISVPADLGVLDGGGSDL